MNKNNNKAHLGGPFAIIGLTLLLALLLVTKTSCTTEAQTPEDDKVYIEIDGHQVELVADEYGNQYLKQTTGGAYMYIPFQGEVDDETDSIQFYNTKN